MSLWIQQGYGKGDKLARLASKRGVEGVLLSPADETAERLSETATDCRGEGLAVAVDPQTYVYSIPEGAGRLHDEHGLAFGDLSWAPPPNELATQVQAVLQLNDRLGTESVISPAPLQQSFDDVWAPVALQYARATVEAADKPVLATLAVADSGFASWETVERWLDVATTLDVAGFYLIVSKSGPRVYPPLWDEQILTNILRLVHRLSVLNSYRLLWGYADVAGLLGVAAGASGFGSGWFYSLRTFSPSKWQPSSGGAQAVPRVFASGLLTALEAQSEGRAVARSALAAEAFPGRRTRRRIADHTQGWGQTDAWYQHLKSLASVGAQVARRTPGTGTALDFTDERIRQASARLETLRRSGVTLRPAYANTLDTYSAALRRFRTAEGV